MNSNVAKSVKQKLLNYSRERKVDYNLVLIRYATERFLYRLSKSKYRDSFFLKGAMLFALWKNNTNRATKDMDILFLSDIDAEGIGKVVREVVGIRVVDDGLIFEEDSLNVGLIREDNAYGGLRVNIAGFLEKSKIIVQVDVGLGDAVFPEPEWNEYPTLLEFPAPKIRTYPIYTVISEKIQAIVELGFQNSRMKDYYDLYYLIENFSIEGDLLSKAIGQTFARRKTEIPTEIPTGLSVGFVESDKKRIQWEAFLRKSSLEVNDDWGSIVERIREFIMPIFSDEEK